MKYKNIIFDFGNVIGKFKGDYILGKFASTPEDYDILADAIFRGAEKTMPSNSFRIG